MAWGRALWSFQPVRAIPHPSSVALVAVIAAGAALRFYHLGTFSLWWDEIVHIWTSQSGGLADVVAEVKRGIPPGAGNAGAVPLDYALLHLYLRIAPPPAPEDIEAFYRFPSFVYSWLALPLLYAFGRRFLDRQVALLATLLLALSLPHMLYAAEARFYSLFVLTTLTNLYAFANVISRRDRYAAWAAYAAVNVVYFFSGLFSLLVLAIQYAILGTLLASALAGSGQGALARGKPLFREATSLLATGLVLAACVAAYFVDTSLGHKYNRDPSRVLDPLFLTWNTLLAFSSGNYLLVGLLLLFPLPLLYARRRGPKLLPVVLYLELSLLLIPLVIETARWKHYYFHPRHALFLLPAVQILTALSLATALRAIDPFRLLRLPPSRRAAANVTLAATLVVATQLSTLRDFVEKPERFFSSSKKTQDMKRLTQTVRDRVAGFGPREKYLLVAQRNSLVNTALAQYLRWYGLDDRVVLRGMRSPTMTYGRLVKLCRDGCLGLRGPVVDRALQLTAPTGLLPEFQRLLGLLEPVGRWPGTVERIGLVAWTRGLPKKRKPGFSRESYRGLLLLETDDQTVARPREDAAARAPAAGVAAAGSPDPG